MSFVQLLQQSHLQDGGLQPSQLGHPPIGNLWSSAFAYIKQSRNKAKKTQLSDAPNKYLHLSFCRNYCKRNAHSFVFKKGKDYSHGRSASR